MDNGVLVFIIALEAVIIIWLLSKLKHYQNFERLLRPGGQTQGSEGSAVEPTAGGSNDEPSAGAVPRHVSTAHTPAVESGASDELLNTPGTEPEINIEEAKRVQLVMARCRYAEFYLEQLDDDYERGQFQRIVDSCISTATGIEDPFFRASALHPIILLFDSAGWEDQRDQLMAIVPDDIIRQRIISELA